MKANPFAAALALLFLSLPALESPCPAANPSNDIDAGTENLLETNPRLKALIAAANRGSGPEEIVRLADAGADASVIQTYVESSGRKYDLNADQIIQLHKRGVSSGVIASMIRSGANAEAQTITTPSTPTQPIVIKSESPELTPTSTVTYIPNSPRPVRVAYRPLYVSAYPYASYTPSYYGGYNHCGYRPSYCYGSAYWNYRPAWSHDFRYHGCW